jgi:hypothetical protein
MFSVHGKYYRSNMKTSTLLWKISSMPCECTQEHENVFSALKTFSVQHENIHLAVENIFHVLRMYPRA